MVIESRVSHPEMMEAFRMNLTPSFWFRAVFSNMRAVVLIVVFVVAAVTKIAHGDSEHWGTLVIILGGAAFFIGLYVWRLSRSLKKTAEQVNASISRFTLDSQGLGTASYNGATTFAPWSQFSRWKEGKLVFTIGNGKTFNTVPKSALNGMQVSEVRGTLESQIRGG